MEVRLARGVALTFSILSLALQSCSIIPAPVMPWKQLIRSPMTSMSLILMDIFSLHLDLSAVFDIVDIFPSFSLKHSLPLLLCFHMILASSDYFGYISVCSALVLMKIGVPQDSSLGSLPTPHSLPLQSHPDPLFLLLPPHLQA